MVAAGLTQPKYLAWKPASEFGIGEKHSGRTRYVDTGRDIARAVVTDDDGLGSGGHLENAYAPMQAGIHARGVQQFEGELDGVVEVLVLGFRADDRGAGAGGGDAGCGEDARRHTGCGDACRSSGRRKRCGAAGAAGGDGRRRRAPRYVGAVCGEVSGRRRAADHRSRGACGCGGRWCGCGVTGHWGGRGGRRWRGAAVPRE